MTIEVRNQDGSLTRRKIRNRITACEKCRINPIRTINYPYCALCDTVIEIRRKASHKCKRNA